MKKELKIYKKIVYGFSKEKKRMCGCRMVPKLQKITNKRSIPMGWQPLQKLIYLTLLSYFFTAKTMIYKFRLF